MRIILILILLLSSVVTFAQDKSEAVQRQNFEGTWVFDAKASDDHPALEELYQGKTLEITLKEPEFKITNTQTVNSSEIKIDGTLLKKGERRSATLILYTDNRGEVNKPYPFNPTLEIGSKTEWKKNVLVRSYATDVYVSGKLEGDIKTTETYSVSKSGKVLTVITKSKANFNAGESSPTRAVAIWIYGINRRYLKDATNF